MARSLGRVLKGYERLGSLSPVKTPPFSLPCIGVAVRTTFARTMATKVVKHFPAWQTLPSAFASKHWDFSLPNSSWGAEMMRLYEHYNSLCEVETEAGQKKGGPWKRLPSYDRLFKYDTDGAYLSKKIQSTARFFTRNIRDPGAAFEYVLFVNSEEQKCVCIFQAGHLLEGAPGYVHGGAIATMIDTVTGTHATLLSGPVMTANFNINYRSPILLGSTVLLESSLDKKEGRKTTMSCKVTSADGSRLHAETTALFLSINVSHVLLGG